MNGADLLDEVEMFLARFVAYPSDWQRGAHTLWIAHTWFMDAWESTPRLAFLSPEPGSGKSRALEVTEPLVPRPVHCVNVSPAYLFRKIGDPDGAPTLLYDEIDTVFGPKAKDNEEVRGLLNAGHRKGATAGRCVGPQSVPTDFEAYCAVALAGLDDLPDTIMTRSVVVRMRRRAPGERVEPWRERLNGPQGRALGDRLAQWANANQHAVSWPDMPEGVEDRDADVWEALLAVADLAGGHWPESARRYAVTAVTEKSEGETQSIGVLLLRDLRTIFNERNRDRLTTAEILQALNDLDESPWGDIRGKELDARSLARRLTKYRIKPTVYREGATTHRGYLAEDLIDAWERYLPAVPPSGNCVTDVTAKQSEPAELRWDS